MRSFFYVPFASTYRAKPLKRVAVDVDAAGLPIVLDCVGGELESPGQLGGWGGRGVAGASFSAAVWGLGRRGRTDAFLGKQLGEPLARVEHARFHGRLRSA